MFEEIQAIVEKFLVKGQLQQILPIEIGHINQTYQIVTIDSAASFYYILQKINTQIFSDPAAVMNNIAKVGTYLKQATYPRAILSPISTKEKQLYVKDKKEQYWRMFPFISNSTSYNEVKSEEKAYKAAFAFGEYMRYLKDFDSHQLHYSIPDFHNTNLRFQQFYNIIKNADKEKVANVKDLIASLFDFRYLISIGNKLKIPLRVVHSDTKINNILFDKDQLEAVCVIDLDTLMPGNLIHDYGDMVRTFTPPVDENSEDYQQVYVRNNILQSLTTGFLDGLKDGIAPLEKQFLLYGAKLIIFEQALRFLTDYLNDNAYYKVSYPNQNLVRAKNQVCLLKDLVRKT